MSVQRLFDDESLASHLVDFSTSGMVNNLAIVSRSTGGHMATHKTYSQLARREAPKWFEQILRWLTETSDDRVKIARLRRACGQGSEKVLRLAATEFIGKDFCYFPDITYTLREARECDCPKPLAAFIIRFELLWRDVRGTETVSVAQVVAPADQIFGGDYWSAAQHRELRRKTPNLGEFIIEARDINRLVCTMMVSCVGSGASCPLATLRFDDEAHEESEDRVQGGVPFQMIDVGAIFSNHPVGQLMGRYDAGENDLRCVRRATLILGMIVPRFTPPRNSPSISLLSSPHTSLHPHPPTHLQHGGHLRPRVRNRYRIQSFVLPGERLRARVHGRRRVQRARDAALAFFVHGFRRGVNPPIDDFL